MSNNVSEELSCLSGELNDILEGIKGAFKKESTLKGTTLFWNSQEIPKEALEAYWDLVLTLRELGQCGQDLSSITPPEYYYTGNTQ